MDHDEEDEEELLQDSEAILDICESELEARLLRIPLDPDGSEARMTTLARTFPCLRGAPGVSPWGPSELNRWAVGGASHGERVSASFILAVWDSSTDWEAGRFDVMEALNVWPPSHRQAFLRWAAEPWWP